MGGPSDDVRKYSESKFQAPSADVARFNSADEDNFTQCGIFFRDVLNADEQFRLVDNIAAHFQNAQDFLQERAIKQFLSADKKYGEMLRERINFYKRKTTSTALQPISKTVYISLNLKTLYLVKCSSRKSSK